MRSTVKLGLLSLGALIALTLPLAAGASLSDAVSTFTYTKNMHPQGYSALVSGNYQSGISVVDFTDPANAKEIAFADPAPLSNTTLIGGGDWSSYWYDGRIYESDMKRGLIIWNLSDSAVAGATRLGHLNPQTQETSFPLRGRRR